jgi:hypothetical protein
MVKKKEFKPFRNESDCITIGEDLNIENRVDMVSIFGSIDLTLDKEGLKAARELKAILDQIFAEIEKSNLPEHITLAKAETVPNPF